MERSVLVTGGGSGIGLATCLHLAAIGFEVIGVVPDHGEGQDLAGAAAKARVDVRVIVADLSEPSQRQDLLSGLALWGLVNNAGYMNAGTLQDVTIDDARRQLEAMVLAPMDLVIQALPGMISRGAGRIVNVTSSAVHASTPLTGWYQASKAALRELNDSLRLTVARAGIDVIDVEPGGYRTAIWRRAARELESRRAVSDRPDLYDRVLDRIGRVERLMARPEEVAACIARVLTAGRPPRHVRVGPGSRLLRLASEVVPDAWWDRLVGSAADP